MDQRSSTTLIIYFTLLFNYSTAAMAWLTHINQIKLCKTRIVRWKGRKCSVWRIARWGRPLPWTEYWNLMGSCTWIIYNLITVVTFVIYNSEINCCRVSEVHSYSLVWPEWLTKWGHTQGYRLATRGSFLCFLSFHPSLQRKSQITLSISHYLVDLLDESTLLTRNHLWQL